MFGLNPIQIGVLVLFGLSLAANVFLGKEYLGERDVVTTVKTETVYVKAAAEECSKGTEALASTAKANAVAAAPRRAAAAASSAAHDKKADQILATPAAVPGDACKSAEAALDTWWDGRKP